MSDTFKINWVERMKTDPTANSILNNKIKHQQFTTYKYWFNRRDNRWYYDGTQTRPFTRRMNQLYSDLYTQDMVGVRNHRLGFWRRGGDIIGLTDNENKYWDNTIPSSIYNHKSIAQASNPKIDGLSSLPVYQKKM